MSLLTLQGLIGVVFAFSFAIFVHELGHFMFAKLFGVKVDAFSIGFGKRLFGFRRGDTEYKICAIPFGGYVKMVGTVSREMEDVLEGKKIVSEEEREDTEEAAAELSAPAPVGLAEGIQDEVNALRNKSYWQKLLVFAAGCINNVITAILIFFLLYWIGFNGPPPLSNEIGGIEAVPAELSPIKVGDRIVSVGGETVGAFEDFQTFFLGEEKPADIKQPVKVEVLRDGTTQTVELPAAAPLAEPLPAGDITAIGDVPVENAEAATAEAVNLLNKDKNGPVAMTVKTAQGTTTVKALPVAAMGVLWPTATYYPVAPARVNLLLPNLPAEKSGLKAGDIVLSIDDQPVSTSFQATRILRKMPGKTAQLLVARPDDGGTTTTHKVALEVRPNPDNPALGQIGVAFGEARTEHIQLPFGEALHKAVNRAGNMVIAYVDAIQRIFGSSFRTIRENLSGPIGISVQFYKVAQSGWFEFFVTFAMFNIVLALTNLLPLPVLDGGHILFATIEAIIRRPLPAKVMVGIYNLFTFLIIALALMITFNDLIMNAWRVVGK